MGTFVADDPRAGKGCAGELHVGHVNIFTAAGFVKSANLRRAVMRIDFRDGAQSGDIYELNVNLDGGASGVSRREAIRCLKRLLARVVFNALKASPALT